MSHQPMTTDKIREIFGCEADTKTLIFRNWNSEPTIQMGDEDNPVVLGIELAPSFGGLTWENAESIHENLKVLIAETIRIVKRKTGLGHPRNWQAMVQAFSESMLIELDGDEIAKADTLTKTDKNWFDLSGGQNTATLYEVIAWFEGLINDRDILEATDVPLHHLADMVTTTRVVVNNIQPTGRLQRQKLVEICLLRLPDPTTPYMKLCQITLFAWFNPGALATKGHEENGIMGEYRARRYKPNEGIIASMRPGSRTEAIKQTEDIFAEYDP